MTDEPKGTAKYGKLYWCIKTPLSQDGEIYLMADKLEIDVTGTLLCFGHQVKDADASSLLVAFAPGQWTVFYAASVFDGSAITVERWKGEVVR